MPKMKTHSGTKDRIRVTKKGKIMARSPFGNHFLGKKSSARKRRYAGMKEVVSKHKKSIRKNLGV